MNFFNKRAAPSHCSTTQNSARKTVGNKGEQATALYLINKGFTIIAMNYTTRTGEVDVIATKDDVIAFVEVKTRTKTTFALSQVITPTKQKRIISAAKEYIVRQQLRNKLFRFDVALVKLNDNCTIEYIENAFQEKQW